MKSFLFKIKTNIRRFVVRTLKLNRPTIYPFITGDGFRSLSQHFFDEVSDFAANKVEENDIIFVRSDFLMEFFIKKHPLIKNKYILISHNTDTNIEKFYEDFVDDKIIHWFAQNLLFTNKKVTPLPIGLTNYYYGNINDRGKIAYLQNSLKLLSNNGFKKNRIAFGFSLSSNKERVALNDMLRKNRLTDEIKSNNQLEYFKKVSDYKFIISPEGNGVDCYRTWESLYLKIVPIVKKSIMTEYFFNMGLPLLLVSEWKEVELFSEDFLIDKYEELKEKFDYKSIYINYWIELILSKKIK
jgi:hypothetical protein